MRRLLLTAALSAACALCVPLAALGQAQIAPPVAPRKPVASTHHGVRLVDDYAWLRTADHEALLARPDLLEAPIRAHLDAERLYADHLLAPNKKLEETLATEMRGRTSQQDDAVPVPYGPFLYTT